MKLFFLKEHSLYKIFKTLEKIPNGRTLYIYIDPEHAFFDNEWRGKEIKELIEKKNMTALFVTKTDKTRYFFSSLWLSVSHQEKHKIIKYLRLIYNFFFNIKKFHLQIYTQKNYIFYVVFGFEIIFVLLILYLLYSLILPSTDILITPSSQIESMVYNFRYYPSTDLSYEQESRYLSIPYFTGYIDYKYDMNTSTSNIKHVQQPSQWTIELRNRIPQEYSFLPNTKFVTSDGLSFVSVDAIKLPAGTENNEWKTMVTLKAMDQDINGTLMWARWNLFKWTRVFIKNLKDSYYTQNIYGQVTEDFSGWSMSSQWTVSAKDIMIFSGKMVDYIYKQKKNIIFNNFKLPDNLILSFDPLITTQIKNVVITNIPWEKSAVIKWYVVARLSFYYIKRPDLLAMVNKYVTQRMYDKMQVFDVDSSSIVFFKDIKMSTGDSVWIIPTKVDIKQMYDFSKDINWIVPDLKSRVVGLTQEKAREVLFSYPEISSFTIKIKPPWYTTISKLKSRILVSVWWNRLK